jgi:hypothetical protein
MKILYMKKIKLTEDDIQRIVKRIVLEQEQEMIQLQSKDIKPVFTPEKLTSVKSQADMLAKDTEMIKQVLQTLKMADPEAYHMITRGSDPLNPTALGNLVNIGTVLALIYTIVQEIKGN